jgi:cell division protein FtsB
VAHSPRAPRRSFAILRWLGLAVVLAIAFGYVQPIRAYFNAKEDVAVHRAEKAALVRKQERLKQRLALAGTEEFVEREARRLGLVKPGERLFIVTGIETWKRSHVP